VWYDAERNKARDEILSIKYIKQCWGINVQLIKRPGDFNALFLFELRGLTKGFKT
jgi:hypothetical protein